MRKIVYIEKDEQNAIAVCKDNFRGIVVQLIRFVDQLKPAGLEKELTNIRTNQVVCQWEVKILDKDKKVKEDFREDVEKAIKEAKQELAKIKNQDQKIDGLLETYYSQNKVLNDTQE